MIRRPEKSDALAAMAAANPVSTRSLAEEIGTAGVEAAMARAMVLGERVPAWESLVSGSGGHHGGRRFGAKQTASKHRRAAVGLGLVGAGAISALLIFSGWLAGGRATRPEFAAAAIEVAEANPRLLVSMPGWQIVRADEFEPDEGELSFSDGWQQLELHWYPARQYESFLADRSSASSVEAGTLLGQRATTVDYGREEYATMLSPQGTVFIEVRGQLGDKDAYERILHSLRPVDVDTWLSAMPASTVRPAARTPVVSEMLRGIPLPAGFDPASLQGEGSISDRESLAVKVANAVACGWAQSWIAARKAGETAAAQRALAAIAGASGWPIVRETNAPWFSNYAVVAREMRAGHLNWGPAGYETETNGKTFGVGPSWKLTLGCGGTYRREVKALPGG